MFSVAGRLFVMLVQVHPHLRQETSFVYQLSILGLYMTEDGRLLVVLLQLLRTCSKEACISNHCDHFDPPPASPCCSVPRKRKAITVSSPRQD